MALKDKVLKIESGRDVGKAFLITEMPLLKADRWATRALFALAKGGADVDGLDPTGGMMEMAKVATSAIRGLNSEEGIDLLNELLDCAQIIPSGGLPRQIEYGDADGIGSEIEELTTLFHIRKEALLLHLNFLTAGSSQTLED